MVSKFQNSDIKSEKYLVFKLFSKDYGIPILKVDGINDLMKITPLPESPVAIKGIINLRGQIIPVIDLRIKFNMPECEHNEKTCIIVVNVSNGSYNKQVGLIVDTVSEVFDIPISQIEDPPHFENNNESGSLLGIGKAKDKLIMILDIDKIVEAELMFSVNEI